MAKRCQWPVTLASERKPPLQDPFRSKPTDTAVTAIARTTTINIRQAPVFAEAERAEEPRRKLAALSGPLYTKV